MNLLLFSFYFFFWQYPAIRVPIVLTPTSQWSPFTLSVEMLGKLGTTSFTTTPSENIRNPLPLFGLGDVSPLQSLLPLPGLFLDLRPQFIWLRTPGLPIFSPPFRPPEPEIQYPQSTMYFLCIANGGDSRPEVPSLPHHLQKFLPIPPLLVYSQTVCPKPLEERDALFFFPVFILFMISTPPHDAGSSMVLYLEIHFTRRYARYHPFPPPDYSPVACAPHPLFSRSSASFIVLLSHHRNPPSALKHPSPTRVAGALPVQYQAVTLLHESYIFRYF